jgi:hypothetical protein
VHRAFALLAGTLIVLVSASGALLVFRAELDDVVFGGAVRVEPAGTPAPLQALLEAARARHPDLTASALGLMLVLQGSIGLFLRWPFTRRPSLGSRSVADGAGVSSRMTCTRWPGSGRSP